MYTYLYIYCIIYIPNMIKEACYILNRHDVNVFYFCGESMEQTPKN